MILAEKNSFGHRGHRGHPFSGSIRHKNAANPPRSYIFNAPDDPEDCDLEGLQDDVDALWEEIKEEM